MSDLTLRLRELAKSRIVQLSPAPIYRHLIEAAAEIERLNAQLEAIWNNCRVVLYPPIGDPNGDYPLEHAPRANKDMRAAIIRNLGVAGLEPTTSAFQTPRSTN